MEVLMVIVGVGLWGYIGVISGRFWWRWEFLKSDISMYGKDLSMQRGPIWAWALLGPASFLIGALLHYTHKDCKP